MLSRTTCILAALLIGLAACKKNTDEPQNPQGDNEKITDVYLYLTDTTVSPHVVKTFSWKQMDVSVSPVINSDTLTAGKNYLGKVLMLDRTKTQVDTLSNEFEEPALKLEHQFFYIIYPDVMATASYLTTDVDANGVPVGTKPLISAKLARTGYLHMVLKHQPGQKPTSGGGNSSLGTNDLDIVFPMIVK